MNPQAFHVVATGVDYDKLRAMLQVHRDTPYGRFLESRTMKTYNPVGESDDLLDTARYHVN